MLVPDKEFMGYCWTAFCTRASKTTRKHGKREDLDDFGGFVVILFATKGHGLDDVDIGRFLNWFMPLQLNVELPVCKAFARIDLGKQLRKALLFVLINCGRTFEDVPYYCVRTKSDAPDARPHGRWCSGGSSTERRNPYMGKVSFF